MKTTAALLERALQIVDNVGGGQPPSAEDTQYALDALVSLIAELNKRGIAYIAINTDDLQAEGVPEELFNPIAAVLAADLQTAFQGGIIDDATREGLLNRIRRITSIGPSFEPQQIEWH